MSTVETAADLEQLVADLLEEAHALRMKYEEFSRYTEAKVAELAGELQVALQSSSNAENRYRYHALFSVVAIWMVFYLKGCAHSADPSKFRMTL
jgi:hypothetical protein